MFLPMFMGLGGPEIIFIVLIIVLLFGAKKIPELMRGVGKGVKSFKDGINGIGDIENANSDKTAEAEKDNK